MAKKDSSPRVQQRDKVKEPFAIRELELTDYQKEILTACLDKKTQMVIMDGLPGSSKTYLAVLAALKLLNEKRIGQIFYIRSVIQAKDGEIGYLCGGLNDKTYYFNVPLHDKLSELLSKPDRDKLLQDNRIITYPTGMLRGYSFSYAAVIVDEAQNLHFDSIYTCLTRLGKFSKVFVLGDTTGQNDYGNKSGFQKCCSLFNDEESVQNGVRYFSLGLQHIVRSDFVKFVVKNVQNLP